MKTKKKPQEQESRKKSSVVFQPESSVSEEEQSKTEEFRLRWENEIEELRGQEYASVEDAIDAMIDLVLKKQGGSSEEVRKGLLTMFAINPEMKAQLCKALNLKA